MSLTAAHARRRLVRTALRSGDKPRRRVSGAFWMGLLAFLGAVAVVVVAALIWGIVWFGQFAGALPPAEKLTSGSTFQTTRVLADDGTSELYEITDPQGGRRTVVTLDQVPRHLIEATIATEDPGFFSNPGFEVRSIVRAAVDDFSQQQIVSGASTITQQVVRGVLLTPAERNDLSAGRKLKEIILAYQLTQTYTKQEILQVYLNQIFYGNRSYGIEAAAEGYFGKSAASLDLAECAMLAGIPQAPSLYDPYTRLDDVKERQQYVLQRMVDQHYITPDEALAAAAEDLHFVDRRHAVLAPHFVAYVSDLLENQLGTDRLYHGGDSAVTTLDVPLQTLAENAVSSNLQALSKSGANNAALVAIDPSNGHILAMVGSASYDDSSIAGEVNMALSPRDSAGILSPLTYSLALRRGETLLSPMEGSASSTAPAPVVQSAPGQVGAPAPTRTISLRDALGLGVPMAAVQAMALAGNQDFVNLGTAIGIADFGQRVAYGPNQTVVSAKVSPLEVAQTYATSAAGGVARTPIAIDRIVDPSGNVIRQTVPDARPALDPGIAYLVTSVLADPTYRQAMGDPAPDTFKDVAERTAISEDRLDGWMAGYSTNLAVVVWIGNSNGRALTNADAAAQIWRSFEQGALRLRPAPAFVLPADDTQLSLCKNPACSVRQSLVVLRGTEKAVESANAASIAVPSPAAGSSQTPLVNRNGVPTPSASPATAQSALATTRQISRAITVPDVSQSLPDVARQRLTVAGLTIAPIIQYQSSAGLAASKNKVAVGQVVSTSPAAGQTVAPGTSVVLIVRRN